MRKQIILKNYKWYLCRAKEGYSPSGYFIAQYIDGIFFEEQSENSIEPLKVIKKLHEKKDS